MGWLGDAWDDVKDEARRFERRTRHEAKRSERKVRREAKRSTGNLQVLPGVTIDDASRGLSRAVRSVTKEAHRVGRSVRDEYFRTDPTILMVATAAATIASAGAAGVITGYTSYGLAASTGLAAGDQAAAGAEAYTAAKEVKKKGEQEAQEILMRAREDMSLIRAQERDQRQNLRRRLAAVLGAQKAEYGAAGLLQQGTPALAQLRTIADELTDERHLRKDSERRRDITQRRAAVAAATTRANAREEAHAMKKSGYASVGRSAVAVASPWGKGLVPGLGSTSPQGTNSLGLDPGQVRSAGRAANLLG